MLVFTSCINNYIPKARILASSLKKFHPTWTFCLLLGETPPDDFYLEKEPFDRLLTFEQLHIPNYSSWLFRHRVVEICTAAKGPALSYFLVREKHDKVMYLDPDIMVCNSLTPLDNLLDSYDILLTPHMLAPQKTTQSIIDNELCALQHGTFNLGFVAVANRGDGLRFSNWWRDRLLSYCYDDIPSGIFTDQRWCDLAPSFFPNMHIVRDPGCNAASWNLTDRTIIRDSHGTFFANENPLCFYHFTGFDSGAGDIMIERYAKNMPAVYELWKIYRNELEDTEQFKLYKLPWLHATFDDGTPITDAMRALYRKREDVQQAFPNPFKRPGFLEWYYADQNVQSSKIGKLKNKTASILYRTRSVLDKHGGFPQGLPGAAEQAVEWVKKWGIRGVIKKIWESNIKSPAIDGFYQYMPDVMTILSDRNSQDYKSLFRMLDPLNTPVCVFEHDWGGGAASYCDARITNFLSQGKAIIRVRYVTKSARVEITVCHGSEHLRFGIKNLKDLADNRFPRIHSILINELAAWYFWNYDSTGLSTTYATIQKTKAAVLDIISIAQQHASHVEFMFHDYFAVCPTMHLITPEYEYCGLPEQTDGCDQCALRGQPFSMKQWRDVWGKLLAICDEIVFFSENTRETVSKVYQLREEQIRIKPHVVDMLEGSVPINQNGPMCIAVVGHIHLHKGAHIVAELGRILEQHMPEATIVVFGKLVASDIPQNTVVLGEYKRDELPSLLKQHAITVSFTPSVCPETFSYVAHELAYLGVPQVCFGIGAQGEYIKSLSNSRVAHEITAQSAFEALQGLDIIRKDISV